MAKNNYEGGNNAAQPPHEVVALSSEEQASFDEIQEGYKHTYRKKGEAIQWLKHAVRNSTRGIQEVARVFADNRYSTICLVGGIACTYLQAETLLNIQQAAVNEAAAKEREIEYYSDLRGYPPVRRAQVQPGIFGFDSFIFGDSKITFYGCSGSVTAAVDDQKYAFTPPPKIGYNGIPVRAAKPSIETSKHVPSVPLEAFQNDRNCWYGDENAYTEKPNEVVIESVTEVPSTLGPPYTPPQQSADIRSHNK